MNDFQTTTQNPTVTVATDGRISSASQTADIATNRAQNQTVETLKRIIAMLDDYDGGTWGA
jgi:hypothetical protein